MSSPPPSKVLKPSAKATDVKEAAAFLGARPEEGANSSAIEAVLGTGANGDLLHKILSFVIHRVSEEESYAVRSEKREGVVQSLRACLAVSKIFNQVTWSITTPDIPGVISSADLINIKKNLCHLDLTSLVNPFVTDFMNYVDLEGDREFLNRFMSVRIWAKCITRHYKYFLLVKAVECFANNTTNSNDGEELDLWKERCKPCESLHVFWKTHQKFPRSYAKACKTLVGSKTMGGEDAQIDPHSAYFIRENLDKFSAVLGFEENIFTYLSSFLLNGDISIGLYATKCFATQVRMRLNLPF